MINKIISLVLMMPLLTCLVAASMVAQQHISATQATAPALLIVLMFYGFAIGLYFLFE